ncbi:glycosyl transferase [Fibrobacterales bacterium]|nr:glycosyl transferase [Fibrobacterales bacterium]
MRKKIAIDTRMLAWMGAGTYLRNLLKHIDYGVLIGDEKKLSNSEYIGRPIGSSVIIPFTSPIYGLKEQINFPYCKLKKCKPNILHIPHCNIPIFYRGKIVVTIHDLTHLLFPKLMPQKYKHIGKLVYLYLYFMFWFSCKRANHIITVSHNTKNDIIKTFKINPEKISVVHLGVSEEFVIKEKSQVEYLIKKYKIPQGEKQDKKIILFVGNFAPNKNLERLISAFEKIAVSENSVLVLAGKSFDKLKVGENIIKTGYLTQEELVDFYNLANLFIFPSIYEGFGLPILEAFACGTPVACSNTGSLPEVGGDLAFYFSPTDENSIAEQIVKALNSPCDFSYRQKLRNYALQFSWEETAKKTLEILERV